MGLTSKGSLSAKYYREVKTGMQSEVGSTNVSAVESVGEVDHIAYTRVELGHEAQLSPLAVTSMNLC